MPRPQVSLGDSKNVWKQRTGGAGKARRVNGVPGLVFVRRVLNSQLLRFLGNVSSWKSRCKRCARDPLRPTTLPAAQVSRRCMARNPARHRSGHERALADRCAFPSQCPIVRIYSPRCNQVHLLYVQSEVEQSSLPRQRMAERPANGPVRRCTEPLLKSEELFGAPSHHPRASPSVPQGQLSFST